MINNTILSTLAILCCHLLTGFASVITRHLVQYMAPEEIAFMRYFFGGLILCPFLFIFRTKKINHVMGFKIIALGVLFFALFPFLFSYSFVYTTAARGALVLATMPIWAMLISAIIDNEKPNRLFIVAAVTIFFGLAIALSDKLLIDAGDIGHFRGEFIMVGAAMTGAIYAIMSRSVLEQIPASIMTPLCMLSGCLFLVPFVWHANFYEHLLLLPQLEWKLLLFMGVVSGGIAFFLFNWSLTKSSATYTGMFIVINPITTIFLGDLLLKETIRLNFIIGVITVSIGLAIAIRAQLRQVAG